MKRVSFAPSTQRSRGERRRLLREYFLNAITLALMKEAGTLGAPVRVDARRPSRPSA
jgi:hypothetical protein